DAVRGMGGAFSYAAGHARAHAVAARALSLDDARRARRASRRLVHYRDRPAALSDLRPDAHRRRRLAGARRERRHVACAFRPRLRRGLRRRPVLRAEADSPRPDRGRASCERRRGHGSAPALRTRGFARGSDVMEGDWLTLVWLFLIAFAIFMY